MPAQLANTGPMRAPHTSALVTKAVKLMSYPKLAAAMETSESQISRWKHGRSAMSYDRAVKLIHIMEAIEK